MAVPEELLHDDDASTCTNSGNNNTNGNPLLEVENALPAFGKRLANTHKGTRDAAFASLRDWLLEQRSHVQDNAAHPLMTELSLLKLWKGLFYCTSLLLCLRGCQLFFLSGCHSPTSNVTNY
jgi:hypothetical protein